MKRLSSGDDVDSGNDARSDKDLNANRSRSFHSSSGPKGMISPSWSRRNRDRPLDDDDARDGSRKVRKRMDYDYDSHDRQRALGSGHGRGSEHSFRRSESFSVSRRNFPKRFRSNREGSVSSWRRHDSRNKAYEDDRGSSRRYSIKTTKDVRSPTRSREEGKGKTRSSKLVTSSSCSKESCSAQVKSEVEEKDNLAGGSGEMEEGELEPESEFPTQVSLENVEAKEQENTLHISDHEVEEMEGRKNSSVGRTEGEEEKMTNSGISKQEDELQERSALMEDLLLHEDEEQAISDDVVAEDLHEKHEDLTVSHIQVVDYEEDASNGRKSLDVSSYVKAQEALEEPSSTGFDLFSSSTLRRADREEQSGVSNSKVEKTIPLESLDLSLSLPNLLLPIVSFDGHGRNAPSIGTLQTNSDGLTASMSCSGSQTVLHNPSCSLIQNSLEMENQEQSVHSKPIFKCQDGSICKINLNELHCSPNGQGFTGNVKQFPARQAANLDLGSDFCFEKKQSTGELQSNPFFLDAINVLITNPVHAIAWKFHEICRESSSSLSPLKDRVRAIMLDEANHVMLSSCQATLRNRADITLETLSQSHRAHLEILLALKTGLPEYLHVDETISSTDLAEIFMDLRCKNVACQSALPVDQCDCKVCSKTSGFCSSCMCLVCLKFDTASNTCSWVGCDVCLHWCHVDCALEESYIRNGVCSSAAAPGTTETQFHCVACDHPSEMFGFVKEVFQNFAKQWSLETFFCELEYVKKIFAASKDGRGRQLHEIATQMLKLLADKSNISDVYLHLMAFLTGDSPKLVTNVVSRGREQRKEINGGFHLQSHDASWIKYVCSEKTPTNNSHHHPFPRLQPNTKDPIFAPPSLQKEGAQKETFFDELVNIVRIKEAEAKMFQARADDARREAEGLRRIVLAKSEKIEQEFAHRINKLRLEESEEARKHKFQEFLSLERAYQEYFCMKVRMESDIKSLLFKLDATRRDLFYYNPQQLASRTFNSLPLSGNTPYRS